MSQIWKKMKKSEMDAREKNFFRRKSFSFYAKKHLSKVEKNRDKININTRGKTLLSSCFFHVSPYVDFERNHRFGKKDLKKATNLEKKATVRSWGKTMKNPCYHTGQNAAFELLFSRIPIRGFREKPSIWEERFEKSNCPKLRKTIDKSMSTHWAKRCF